MSFMKKLFGGGIPKIDKPRIDAPKVDDDASANMERAFRERQRRAQGFGSTMLTGTMGPVPVKKTMLGG